MTREKIEFQLKDLEAGLERLAQQVIYQQGAIALAKALLQQEDAPEVLIPDSPADPLASE